MPQKEEEYTGANWFELTVSGQSVGYYTEVSGLSAEVEVMTYTEGGNNEFVHHLPTRVKHPNLVLKRGMTNTDALERWFRQTHVETRLSDVTLTMKDTENTTVRQWQFANAFPVKWTGPTFSATQSQVATETIELVHQGIRAA
jgi:phage tail-like protein